MSKIVITYDNETNDFTLEGVAGQLDLAIVAYDIAKVAQSLPEPHSDFFHVIVGAFTGYIGTVETTVKYSEIFPFQKENK